MSGTAISVLALPRFLEVALIRAGYSHLDDLDGIDADELATGTTPLTLLHTPGSNPLLVFRGRSEDLERNSTRCAQAGRIP